MHLHHALKLKRQNKDCSHVPNTKQEHEGPRQKPTQTVYASVRSWPTFTWLPTVFDEAAAAVRLIRPVSLTWSLNNPMDQLWKDCEVAINITEHIPWLLISDQAESIPGMRLIAFPCLNGSAGDDISEKIGSHWFYSQDQTPRRTIAIW